MEKPSPKGQESLPSREEALMERRRSEYPSLEDWNALQGGRPRVFYKPHKPDAVWRVVHVYEQHPDPKHRFQSGAIVETLPPHLSPQGKLTMSTKGILGRDVSGEQTDTTIRIPSFMDRTLHGDVCEARSAGAGGGSYGRVRNQEEYQEVLDWLGEEGFQELCYELDDEANPKLVRRPYIAPSAPLEV